MLEQLVEVLKSRGLSDAEIQSVIHEAQIKAQLAQLASQFARQVLSLGNWQDGFGQFNLTIAIAEDDDGNLTGWQWQIDAKHGTIGTIVISGKIDLPTQDEAQAQAQAQADQPASSRSRSNWSKVLDLALRYGVEVKQYERRAISWYAGVILNRIAKQNPTAKNDPEFTQLVAEWNANKSQNAPEAKVN